jgi:Ras family
MADPGKQFKVVLLGEGAVGKTSITMRYTSNSFNEHHKVTVQASFQTKQLRVDGQRVTLAIWDTAGQGLFSPPPPMTWCFERPVGVCSCKIDSLCRFGFFSRDLCSPAQNGFTPLARFIIETATAPCWSTTSQITTALCVFKTGSKSFGKCWEMTLASPSRATRSIWSATAR